MSKKCGCLKTYRVERLVWCVITAAFCWTDVADYHHMTYNKMILVWICLGMYCVYKQGGFRKGNRVFALACAMAGSVICGFFIGTNYFEQYIYYNYTLGVLSVVMFVQYGLVIKSIIKKRQLPRVTTVALLFLVMMLWTQFSPLTDKKEYWVMFLILLPYACVEMKEQDRKDIFKGIIDGLCIGFILCQGYSFLFRPYMPTENGSRLKAFRDYCTFAGMSYMQFYLGYLLKYIGLYKENTSRWSRIATFTGAGFVLALLYMTGGRSSLLGAMAVTAVLIAWLYKGLSLKKAFACWLRKCICIAVLSLALFPVAYAGTRYLPTIIHHPDLQDSESNRLYSFATVVLKQKFLYNGEWNDKSVKASDPWDSVKYITFSECVGDTLCRVVPGLDRVLYPFIGEEIFEDKVTRLQHFHEMGYVTDEEALGTIKFYCEEYEQMLPEYFKTLESLKKVGDVTALTIGGDEDGIWHEQIIKRQGQNNSMFLRIYAADSAILKKTSEEVRRGDDINNGWFAEEEEYSSMQLRNALHLYTIGKLNLTGHGKFSYKMYYETGNEEYLGHAHNIFLIVGYDYGIPAMIFMALAFVSLAWYSLKKGFSHSAPDYLLPAALVIAISVYGWFESGFGCGNSYSIIVFLCAMLWKDF